GWGFCSAARALAASMAATSLKPAAAGGAAGNPPASLPLFLRLASTELSKAAVSVGLGLLAISSVLGKAAAGGFKLERLASVSMPFSLSELSIWLTNPGFASGFAAGSFALEPKGQSDARIPPDSSFFCAWRRASNSVAVGSFFSSAFLSLSEGENGFSLVATRLKKLFSSLGS